ncbi:MAG: ABC transporter substrate-binding protein, partial [Ferrovibrionaceae bacterium]
MKPFLRLAALTTLALSGVGAQAEIVIGASFSITGPAAALGIAPRNTIQLFPTEIAGEKIRYVVLDDATDPTNAARNAHRLVTEEKVDLIIGSTASPPAIAIAQVASESQTVQLAAAPIDLPDERGQWTYRLPQSISLMAQGTIEHMKKSGAKTFGFLGYSDAYGESWLREMTRYGNEAGLKLVSVERFGRADASVTAQALKVLSPNPDAMLVVA